MSTLFSTIFSTFFSIIVIFSFYLAGDYLDAAGHGGGEGVDGVLRSGKLKVES